MKIRVACVDDNLDLLKLYKRLFDRQSDTECVGCFVSTVDLQDSLEEIDPDVLLLDLTIPGETVARQLPALLGPERRRSCIVISGLADTVAMREAVRAGASRCLPKDGSGSAIVQAVREVYALRHPSAA